MSKSTDINSDDIESMSILRGAAATSLYGSAASNGVIMITTKKGSKSDGKPSISVNSSTIFSSVLRYPDYQKTFGQGWDGHFASEENGSWGPRFTNDSRLWGNPVNGKQLYKDFSFLEDQFSDFYGTGVMYDNSVSISGGDETSTYYISYNNVNSDGVVPRDKDGIKKNSFRFNGSKRMKFLNISTSFNYINKETRAIPTGQGQGKSSNLFDDIMQHPADISLVDMEDYKDPNSYANPNNYFSPYLWNPYFTIDNTSNVANVDRLIANTTINVDLIKAYNIKGTLRFGGDVSNTFGHNYDGKYTLNDGSVNKGTQDDIPGYYREFQRNVRQYDMDAMLTGDYYLAGGDISMNLTAGYNQYHRSRTYSEDEVKELVLEQSFPNLANTTATPTVTDGFPEELLRRQSVYGLLELGYKDYLFLTGTARNTWSSALPLDNNSYFYPSGNLGFVVSDAIEALKNNATINLIKLRVGYGQAGNDAPANVIYPVFVNGEVTGGIPFSDLTFPLTNHNAPEGSSVRGYEFSNTLGNPNLQPEISTDFEAGIDLSLFANKLIFDVTYYNRNTEGMILRRTVASSSGFLSIWDNIGEMVNKGIEFTTTITPVRTGSFEWNINYTFAKNKNEVLELTEGLDEVIIAGFSSINNAALKGGTVSHIKGYGTQRTADGKIIVDSETGRPLPTDQLVDLGSTLHDYTMGLMNTIRVNAFTLFFQFDYREGGKFVSYSKQSTMWSGKDPLTTYNDRLPFVVPNSVYVDDNGDYQENTIPITTTDLNNYYTGSWNDESLVLDKTYLKLREVNLTYNLPQRYFTKIFVESASVSLVGSNLWLWTPAENNVVDPEVTTATNGQESEFGEIRGYPSVRNYGFKVSLNF